MNITNICCFGWGKYVAIGTEQGELCIYDIQNQTFLIRTKIFEEKLSIKKMSCSSFNEKLIFVSLLGATNDKLFDLHILKNKDYANKDCFEGINLFLKILVVPLFSYQHFESGKCYIFSELNLLKEANGNKHDLKNVSIALSQPYLDSPRIYLYLNQSLKSKIYEVY